MSAITWISKRLLLTGLVLAAMLFFWPQELKADQLAWLSKEQADQALAYLKNKQELVLFCGCCSEDNKELIQLTGVYIQHPTIGGKVYENYYEVVIKGTNSQDELVEEGIDLAYAHVQEEGLAQCLGKLLGFECDPCVEPWEWEG